MEHGAKSNPPPPWKPAQPPAPVNQPKSPDQLSASALPDGFPPELAYRALAAYSLLRTLSWQLRLSPFTSNVFLRALALPYPNRLLGQIHVCLLRILFPNLNMGYSYRCRGGHTGVSKRRRTEERDGIRVSTIPLRAGDNLTYLDGLSWPLFYDDYVQLTADILWNAMNDAQLTMDFRTSALRTHTLDVKEEDSEEEENDADQQPLEYAKQGLLDSMASRVEHVEELAKPLPQGRAGSRGRALPTRQNRFLNSAFATSKKRPRKQTADSDSDNDSWKFDEQASDSEDDDDEEYTTNTRGAKRKRKKQTTPKPKKMSAHGYRAHAKSETVVKKQKMMTSPGSRVLAVSTAESTGPITSFPLRSYVVHPNRDHPAQHVQQQPAGNATRVPVSDVAEPTVKCAKMPEPQRTMLSTTSSGDVVSFPGKVGSLGPANPPPSAPWHPLGQHRLVTSQPNVTTSSLNTRLPAPNVPATSRSGNSVGAGIVPVGHSASTIGKHQLHKQPPYTAVTNPLSMVRNGKFHPHHPMPLNRPRPKTTFVPAQVVHTHTPQHPSVPPHAVQHKSIPHSQIPRTGPPIPFPNAPASKTPLIPGTIRQPSTISKHFVPTIKPHDVSQEVADSIENLLAGNAIAPRTPLEPISDPSHQTKSDMLLLGNLQGRQNVISSAVTGTPASGCNPDGKQIASEDAKREPCESGVETGLPAQKWERQQQAPGDMIQADGKCGGLKTPVSVDNAEEDKPAEGLRSPEQSAATGIVHRDASSGPQSDATGCDNCTEPREGLAKESSQHLQVSFAQTDPKNVAETTNLLQSREKVRNTRINSSDAAESTAADEPVDESSDSDAWPHFEAVERMRRGVPYHRLPVEQKLNVLEFLLDELLSVDFIAAEVTRRHVVTSCYNFPYGVLPSTSEMETLENDDECVICGLEGELLCCDGCPASYHRNCINVAVGSALPTGRWLCPDCRLVDPAKFGPLRGGKKCALDWFTLNDIDYAARMKVLLGESVPRQGSSQSSGTDQGFEDVGEANAATPSGGFGHTGTPSELRGLVLAPKQPSEATVAGSSIVQANGVTRLQGEQVTPLTPAASTEGSGRTEAKALETADEGSKANGEFEKSTISLQCESRTSAPENGDFHDMEFLIVHGFVFSRRRDLDGTGRDSESYAKIDSHAGDELTRLKSGVRCILPLAKTEISTLLSKIGPVGSSWPFVQIPLSSQSIRSRSLTGQTVSCEQFFASAESYDPSFYMSQYRLAPFPGAKKQRAASHLKHLVLSDYETECARSYTHKLSSVISRDTTCDSSLARDLRLGTSLYSPYQLFTSYMIKLEKTLNRACLLHEMWGTKTKNNDLTRNIWSENVAKCRSVHRLALLLVRLIDAVHSRAFFDNWHRHPQSSGKGDVEADSRSYLPLPSDWTPAGEMRKRKWERCSHSNIRTLLLAESYRFEGAAEGGKIKPNTSGSRKRKQGTLALRSAGASLSVLKANSKVDQPATQCSSGTKNMATPSVDGGNKSTSVAIPGEGAPNQLPRVNEEGAKSLPDCAAVRPCEEPIAASGNLDVRISLNQQEASAESFETGLNTPLLPESTPGNSRPSDIGLSLVHGDADDDNIVSSEGPDNRETVGTPPVMVTDDTIIRKARSAGARECSDQGKGSKKKVAKTQPRRSRRSRRLQHRSDVHDEIVGSLVTGSADSSTKVGNRGAQSNIGMEASIAAERTSKISELEGLILAPFENELLWPVAGRSLFEPAGCLSPNEMKRLARNAGTVVARFLTYNSAFEVGQAAVCHIWRKQCLQCRSFEELLMHIRVLDSYLDKSAINACESLARRTSSSKAHVQKVIRCTQRDVGTGVTHYFVVNKGKLRGCWLSEESVDLSALVLDLSNRRDVQLKRLNERMQMKFREDARRHYGKRSSEKSDGQLPQRSVPPVASSGTEGPKQMNQAASFARGVVRGAPHIPETNSAKHRVQLEAAEVLAKNRARLERAKAAAMSVLHARNIMSKRMPEATSIIPQSNRNAKRCTDPKFTAVSSLTQGHYIGANVGVPFAMREQPQQSPQSIAAVRRVDPLQSFHPFLNSQHGGAASQPIRYPAPAPLNQLLPSQHPVTAGQRILPMQSDFFRSKQGYGLNGNAPLLTQLQAAGIEGKIFPQPIHASATGIANTMDQMSFLRSNMRSNQRMNGSLLQSGNPSEVAPLSYGINSYDQLNGGGASVDTARQLLFNAATPDEVLVAQQQRQRQQHHHQHQQQQQGGLCSHGNVMSNAPSPFGTPQNLGTPRRPSPSLADFMARYANMDLEPRHFDETK